MKEDEAADISIPKIINPGVPTDDNISLRKLQKIVNKLTCLANDLSLDVCFAVNFVSRNRGRKKL
eukprot:snap_masked-scaffold_7-processed-gene-17.17-mRNA-1 protein AED:1.00 eAED:1.00 QI:0/-1/0/0/-1/1/1/0/64